LQEGHQSLGKDLCEGDLVLIYQIKSSPAEIQYDANGEKIILKRILGKGGIIAIAKVLNQISAAGRPDPSEYLRRKNMWWRWMAPVEILSTGGIVLRTDVNKVLGYEPNYTLEGFGNKRSGLKKITEEVYRDLADRFRKSKSKSVLPPPRGVPRGRGAEGTTGESEEHRC
jgi:hypothetical protein